MLKNLACAAAVLLGTTGASMAAPAKYVISFTGYCDGMSLNVYSGIYVTGLSTGCASGVDQGLNTSVNKFSGLVVTGNQNNAPTLYTYSLDLTNQKWAVYISNGKAYAKINSGSFTLGAAAQAGGKASFQK